jgi:hypothetical protein
MTARSCARENDVVAALCSGTWPEGCDEELVMHAESCDICSEVMAIAPALRGDYLAWRGDVQVPAAGQVWWRAAVRARMEAVHAASRPITWAQALAAAGAIGLLVALVGIAWPSVAGTVEWVAGAAVRPDSAGNAAATLLLDLVHRSLPLLVGVALCAVIAPVAVYLVLSDE